MTKDRKEKIELRIVLLKILCGLAIIASFFVPVAEMNKAGSTIGLIKVYHIYMFLFGAFAFVYPLHLLVHLILVSGLLYLIFRKRGERSLG